MMRVERPVLNRQAIAGTMTVIGALSLLLIFCRIAAFAEVKVIETDSVYITGDTRGATGARRIAVQKAQSKALDRAEIFVESLAMVQDSGLTKEEIKAHTAAVLQTEVLPEEVRGTAERAEGAIRIRSTIDTDALAAQIEDSRKDGLLGEQIKASFKEDNDLQKQRNKLVKQLADQTNGAKAGEIQKKLDRVLSQEEANDETNRIWASIGHKLVATEEKGQDVQQADMDRSIVVLEQAVKANPENQRAQYLLAELYLRTGNVNAAEDRLRSAVKIQPSDPAPHMKLGILLRESGRYQEALKEFHFVERLRPHYLPVVFYAGMTLKNMGKCGRSVQYLNRFLKDKRVDMYPRKKDTAGRAVDDCGGARPGRPRHSHEG